MWLFGIWCNETLKIEIKWITLFSDHIWHYLTRLRKKLFLKIHRWHFLKVWRKILKFKYLVSSLGTYANAFSIHYCDVIFRYNITNLPSFPAHSKPDSFGNQLIALMISHKLRVMSLTLYLFISKIRFKSSESNQIFVVLSWVNHEDWIIFKLAAHSCVNEWKGGK